MSNFWIGPNSILCKLFGICSKQKPPAPVPPTPPAPPAPPVPLPSAEMTGFYEGPVKVGLSIYNINDFTRAQIESYLAACARAGGAQNIRPLTDEERASDFATLYARAPFKAGLLMEMFDERTWYARGTAAPAGYKPAKVCPHAYRVVATAEAHGFQWPLYDLTQPDADNRSLERFIGAVCAVYHITPVKRLRDACSYVGTARPGYEDNPYRKRRSPFNNCVQVRENTVDFPWLTGMGLKDVGVIVGGKFCDQVDRWERNGMKWLDILGKRSTYWWAYEDVKIHVGYFGPAAYYTIFNEAAYTGTQWKNKVPPETDAEYAARCATAILNFHWAYKDMLNSLGVPNDHIIISAQAHIAEFKALAAFNGVNFEIHGVNSPETMREKFATFGHNRIMLNGDGPDDKARGAKSNIGSPTWSPSPAQAKEMNVVLLDDQAKGGPGFYATYPRRLEEKEPMDIDRAAEEVAALLPALCGK